MNKKKLEPPNISSQNDKITMELASYESTYRWLYQRDAGTSAVIGLKKEDVGSRVQEMRHRGEGGGGNL